MAAACIGTEPGLVVGHHVPARPVRGALPYLCLVVDIHSRRIVGASAHAEELVKAEAEDPNQLVLHADNGAPMKASTMLATLRRLRIVPSFRRPSVSDDNPFAEALFRTLKYRPGYPRKPSATLELAREWAAGPVACP